MKTKALDTFPPSAAQLILTRREDSSSLKHKTPKEAHLGTSPQQTCDFPSLLKQCIDWTAFKELPDLGVYWLLNFAN